MTFLVHGLSGLVLLRLLLLMLFRFSGGPLPGRGLVRGRGRASFRVSLLLGRLNSQFSGIGFLLLGLCILLPSMV